MQVVGGTAMAASLIGVVLAKPISLLHEAF